MNAVRWEQEVAPLWAMLDVAPRERLTFIEWEIVEALRSRPIDTWCKVQIAYLKRFAERAQRK